MRSSLGVVFFIIPSSCILVNRTVDDSDLDAIAYSPASNWRESGNLACPECLAPDPNLASQRTYHYGINAPSSAQDGRYSNTSTSDVGATSASLNFTGHAVYVYCILPTKHNDDPPSIMSTTNLTFFINGSRVGSFVHDDDLPQQGAKGSRPEFRFQAPVLATTGLPQAQHRLEIKPEAGSVVLLDYVLYSTTLDADDGPTDMPSSDTSRTALMNQKSDRDVSDSKNNKVTFSIAVGSAVGVLALVSSGVFISLCIRRRKSSQRARHIVEGDGPPSRASLGMHGPQPFTPRYFPGTTVPPPRAHSPPASPLIRCDDDDGDEMGPSHGLNFPIAQEHTATPEYTLLSDPISRSSSRLAMQQFIASVAGEEPPHYQDAGQHSLVSTPPFVYPPPPPPPPPILSSSNSPYVQNSTASEGPQASPPPDGTT